MELFSYNHNTIAKIEWGKIFYKNQQFSALSYSVATLVRASVKINDFGFDFHKISLYGIVEATWNITNDMVISKWLY